MARIVCTPILLLLLEYAVGPSNFTDKAVLRQAIEECDFDFRVHGFETAVNNSGASISDWDVSAITDGSELFKDVTYFNLPLSGWDTSQMTNMDSMFESARFFNQALSWETSRVTSMERTFLL